MTKWFVSDLHLFHRNVINYCNRPYSDVVQMFDAIKAQWNSQVKPDDIVFILGDWGLNPKFAKAEYISQFNGHKILIAGNHDSVWPVELDTWVHEKQKNKVANQIEKYLSAGWMEIHRQLILELKDGRNVLLSHLPYLNEKTESIDTRYKEFRPKDQGMVLLHGHLHSRYRKSGRMIDVGYDGDLKLWSEDEIIALINSPQDLIETPISDFYKNRIDQRYNMKGS